MSRRRPCRLQTCMRQHARTSAILLFIPAYLILSGSYRTERSSVSSTGSEGGGDGREARACSSRLRSKGRTGEETGERGV